MTLRLILSPFYFLFAFIAAVVFALLYSLATTINFIMHAKGLFDE